ncbi:caspase, EACC1-associated type [Streptomyces sp. 7R007]
MTSDADWAAFPPRPERTRAVLVGTASHVHPSNLTPVPQAAHGVTALHDLLTGPLGHFAPHGVRHRIDPGSRADVLDLLLHPGEHAPPADGGELDVLLFYFAGHGVVPRGADQVGLALVGTVDRSPRSAATSLPVGDVFDAMRRVPARFRVAVLDCCFSGTALQADQASRIHLLTATEAKRQADYQPGHPGRPTAFTEALLLLLREGVPDGPAHLDLATVHRRLAVTLPAAGRPEPLQRAVGASGDLALTANPAHGTGATRQGLRARCGFALQVRTAAGEPRREHRRHQAARLLSALVRDAGSVLPPDDADLLYYRHLHGVLAGEAGDPAAAAEILTSLAADLSRAAGADDSRIRAVRADLTRWTA